MRTLNDLNDDTRYWLMTSLPWADERYHDELSLVCVPVDREYQGIRDDRYSVRDSIWYAAGLLMRQGDGDVARACRIIQSILTYQFDEPSAVYHGTFYRTPDEPHPPPNPVEWRDYDPNWREFICTVFIIILKEFGALIPTDLQDEMQHSILLAAEGSYERKVSAEYTNISLMSAFLLDFAGAQFDKPQWKTYALSQAEEINRLFDRYKTFNEYNSPTYYGVDFYALALWRKYGSSAAYQSMGESMEAALWWDVAQFYHAGMRNLCGPYDRSYGMDMCDYVAVVGLWIAAAMPQQFAPLPNVHEPFNHSGDYYFFPLVALVETNPPDDVVPYLKTFQEDRYLERTIEPQRKVTAWLSDNLMLGAESDLVNPARSNQFHPATAHWLIPNGTLGWLRTRSAALIQATVKPRELYLSGTDDESYEYVFEVYCTGGDATMIQAFRWTLPGVIIDIKRPDTPFTVTQDGEVLTIQFAAQEGIQLTFTTPK